MTSLSNLFRYAFITILFLILRHIPNLSFKFHRKTQYIGIISYLYIHIMITRPMHLLGAQQQYIYLELCFLCCIVSRSTILSRLVFRVFPNLDWWPPKVLLFTYSWVEWGEAVDSYESLYITLPSIHRLIPDVTVKQSKSSNIKIVQLLD